jgi:hypothetical protein
MLCAEEFFDLPFHFWLAEESENVCFFIKTGTHASNVTRVWWRHRWPTEMIFGALEILPI